MKKSDLEKYLNDYKAEYKKVNGKSLDEAEKEDSEKYDYSDSIQCVDGDCEDCSLAGKNKCSREIK
jgi:septation ring formation regulator EzrA